MILDYTIIKLEKPLILNFDPNIMVYEINFDLDCIYDAEFEMNVVTNQ